MRLLDNEDARVMAGRLMGVFPAWLVLWGVYSREFWAFPRFAAHPGEVLHESDPNVLAGQMHQVQRAVAEQPW
jgi:hypothetical protein